MKTHGLVPQLALCSPARRTRDTLAHVLAAIAKDCETLFVDSLYDSDPDQLMQTIRDDGGQASPLLVVGHNPAVHGLALGLLAENAAPQTLLQAYPTAALAMFDADIADWRDLAPRAASFAGFVRPRDLGHADD